MNTFVEIKNSSTFETLGQIGDFIKIEESRKEMEAGELTLTAPIKYYPLFVYNNTLALDRKLKVFRGMDDGRVFLDMDTAWYVYQADSIIDKDGLPYLSLRATDNLGLIKRRVVPYDTDTVYSIKSGYAGNIIKELIRENMSSLATDATRQIDAKYLIVDENTSDGYASTYLEYNHPNLLDACKQAADISAQNGMYLSFDLVSGQSDETLHFKTFPTCRGKDRTSLINLKPLGLNSGNIDNYTSSLSVKDFKNYAYVKGGGIGSLIIDTERSGSYLTASPFSRFEDIVNNGSEIDLNVLNAAGDAFLRDNRMRLVVTGDLKETPNFYYLRDFTFGDLLPIDVYGILAVGRLNALSISTDQSGVSTFKAAITGEIG